MGTLVLATAFLNDGQLRSAEASDSGTESSEASNVSDATLSSLTVSVYPWTTGGSLGANAPATWSCEGGASAHDGVSRTAASSGNVDIGEFDSSTLAYSGTVNSTVQDVTIDASPTNSAATVTICPWDRQRATGSFLGNPFWEDIYSGHQVGLRRGDNRFTVEVESEDGSATNTYTINILRQPQVINWAEYQNVWVDLASDHTHTYGVWSDGTTVWFVDKAAHKLIAYTLRNLSRDSEKDIELTGMSSGAPRGLWSDGTTMWVADRTSPRIYAYDLNTRARATGKEIFDLSALGTGGIGGIWSDGAIMWATPAEGNSSTRVYAFDMAPGMRKPGAEIVLQGLPEGSYSWKGMWADGVTIFNVDSRSHTIFAHEMASGQRITGAEFSNLFGGTGSLRPYGIWSDGATIWVTEVASSTGYAGRLPFGARHVAAYRMKSGYVKPSTAALRSIKLGDSPVEGFLHDTLAYQVAVPNSTTSLTVEAVSALASSTVSIEQADADDATEGHQASLDIGENPITLIVTNGDAQVTYSLTVTRSSSPGGL